MINLLQNGSHLWQLALQKRKEGRCPLEPGEVAVLLRAMGYPKETQIYVASGQVYGGQNRMAPLRNMFPNLVRSLPLFCITTCSIDIQEIENTSVSKALPFSQNSALFALDLFGELSTSHFNHGEVNMVSPFEQ